MTEAQKLHDPILQADYLRLNQLLEVKDDSDRTQRRELHNEATQIRRKLASDTLAPDWLRDMAKFVVDELSFDRTAADPLQARADALYAERDSTFEDPHEISELHVVGPGPNGYAVTDDRGMIVADGLSLEAARGHLS